MAVLSEECYTDPVVRNYMFESFTHITIPQNKEFFFLIMTYFNPYFYCKAKAWVSLFTSLGGISPDYVKAKVTPYMHAMVYHLPRFLAELQSIKKFTRQGKAG